MLKIGVLVLMCALVTSCNKDSSSGNNNSQGVHGTAFNGTWHGSGTLSTGGSTSPCSPMTLQIEETGTTFNIVTGSFACTTGNGATTVSVGPADFTISNNGLYLGSSLYGTITSNTATATVSGSGATWSFTLNILSDGSLTYTDKTIYNGVTISSSGTFTK